MSRYVLTISEARILSSMEQDRGHSFPEIASASRLFPSGVHAALRRLTDRGFVARTDDGHFVELTTEGEIVRRSQLRRGAVLVVPDDGEVETETTQARQPAGSL